MLLFTLVNTHEACPFKKYKNAYKEYNTIGQDIFRFTPLIMYNGCRDHNDGKTDGRYRCEDRVDIE